MSKKYTTEPPVAVSLDSENNLKKPLEYKTPEELDIKEENIENVVMDNITTFFPDYLTITKQYGKWANDAGGGSSLRLDGLALSKEGEVIVFEFKRGNDDKSVHLQALTYAALISGVTIEQLAEMRAEYLRDNFPEKLVELVKKYPDENIETDSENIESARGETLVQEEVAVKAVEQEILSFALLDEGLELKSEEEIRERKDLFKQSSLLPRIILVAPGYLLHVITTVEWLAEVAPEVKIDCYSYSIFTSDSPKGNLNSTVKESNREKVFVLDKLDLSSEVRSRLLGPNRTRVEEASKAKQTIQKEKMPNAVDLIIAAKEIPANATLVCDPKNHKNQVARWFEENVEPDNNYFIWKPDNERRPILWGYDNKNYAPSTLASKIVNLARDPKLGKASLAGTNWFSYQGETLSDMGKRLLDGDSKSGTLGLND